MRLLTEQEIRDRYYQDGIEDGKKEMAERAEKAEGELKAIKDRIEALEPSIISKIMTEYLNWRDLSFATVESEHKCCEEILEILIKQIGGVK